MSMHPVLRRATRACAHDPRVLGQDPGVNVKLSQHSVCCHCAPFQTKPSVYFSFAFPGSEPVWCCRVILVTVTAQRPATAERVGVATAFACSVSHMVVQGVVH